MKRFVTVLVLSAVTLGLVAPAAEARRLGGGGNIGRQSMSPAMREAPRPAPMPSAAPAPSPARAPSAAVPPSVQPRPGFLNRWGGVIAGVGAGALLGSMLGGNLGGFGAGLGGVINLLLIVGVLYLVYRVFASRRRPVGAGSSMQFAGAGGPTFAGSFQREPSMTGTNSAPARAQAVVAQTVNVPPGFEIEPFVRQAQSAFLRLQAANDDGDLADLRGTTTPEVFAELAMQIRERGDVPQKTDVVTLDAQLLEVVVEGEQMVASLRYTGTVRETFGAPAVPFDEVWHLRRSTRAANDPWVIAGIQQMA